VQAIKPSQLDIAILTPIPNTEIFEQTRGSINFDKLYDLDTRNQETVYEGLRFDIHEAIALVREAHDASRGIKDANV